MEWFESDGLRFSQCKSGYTCRGFSDSGYRRVVVIPTKIKGVPVTEIAPSAFENSFDLISVQGSGIKKISPNAFRQCVNLKRAFFPSLEIICLQAFLNCENLSFFSTKYNSLTNDVSVQQLGVNAFGNCIKLKTVRFFSALTFIKAQGFQPKEVQLSLDLSPRSEMRIRQYFNSSKFIWFDEQEENYEIYKKTCGA